MTPNQQALEDSLAMSNRVQALIDSEASKAMLTIQAELNQRTYVGPDIIHYPDGSKLYIDLVSGNCFATL